MDFVNDENINRYADFVKSLNGGGGKFYIMTFGCQQNEADSEKLAGLALLMGYSAADNPEDADLILVNTCAIREHAELKALSKIGGFKKLKKSNPELIVGVCGCMANESHVVEKLKNSYPYVSFTLAPGDIHRLPEIVAGILSGGKRRFETESDVHPGIIEGLPVMRKERHRAWVSIMYGCNNFCSYCIVPYVRGRERSRRSEDIIRECRDLVQDGCRDITLLGQNVNSYSSDISFAELLLGIAKIDGDFRIRFMTSHPKDVPDELIDVIGAEEKIAPHFHLPLQSGSDRVLSLMNRRSTMERYSGILEKLRRSRPGIAVTSDIIVGFPTESEEDFDATLRALSELRFDMIYSFIYSPRKGTPAAVMDGQVPYPVKKERMSRLLELQGAISLEKNKLFEGRKDPVLVDSFETREGGGICSGRNAWGKLVHFEGTSEMIGTSRDVRIDRAGPFELYGTIVK